MAIPLEPRTVAGASAWSAGERGPNLGQMMKTVAESVVFDEELPCQRAIRIEGHRRSPIEIFIRQRTGPCSIRSAGRGSHQGRTALGEELAEQGAVAARLILAVAADRKIGTVGKRRQ